MTDDLSMSAPNAESAFHLFTAACYLLPLFGAWLADNVLGKYRVVLYLSGFYCLGEPLLPSVEPLVRVVVVVVMMVVAVVWMYPHRQYFTIW